MNFKLSMVIECRESVTKVVFKSKSISTRVKWMEHALPMTVQNEETDIKMEVPENETAMSIDLVHLDR